MGKKLFGSIIIVLVLIVALWVLAVGNTITINTPLRGHNISANSTYSGASASNETTINFSITTTANVDSISNVTVWNSTDNSTWSLKPLCSFTNTTGGPSTTFSKRCNITACTEGRWYFNFTTWMNVTGVGYNDSKVVTTYIDRTAPKVEELFPKNHSNLTSTSVTFYYNVTDDGTNTSNCTLFLQNAGVWEANTSTRDTAIEEDGENNSFSITGLSGGGYLWLVSCEDHAGNEGNSSYSNFTLDYTAPSVIITITDENRIRYITNSIKIKCFGSGAFGGVESTTLEITKPSGKIIEVSLTGAETERWTHEFKNTDTNEAGLYKVDCAVTEIDKAFDYIGKASQKTFTMFYEDVYVEGVEEKPVAELDVSTKEVYTGTISGKQGESKTFSLDGVTMHTLEFIEVTFTSATLRLESDPVEVTLDVGKYRNVDLDGDGKDDVKVTLVSIDEDSRAKVEVINLVKLEEKVKEEREAGLPKVEEKGKAGLWLTILVILVVIAVGYYLLKKRKGKKGQVKFSKQDMGL